MATMLTQTKMYKTVLREVTGWNSREISCVTPANSRGEYKDTVITLKVSKAQALAKVDEIIAAGFEVFIVTWLKEDGSRYWGMPYVRINRKANGFLTVCNTDAEWGSFERYTKHQSLAKYKEYLAM